MTPAKGYAEMKDSGIHWIGKIPKHWDLIRAKFHFTQTNNRGNENPVLLAASQKYGVCPQSQLEGVVQVSENTDLQQFKTVHKNDFVISLRSFQGGFERSDFEGVCSPAYQVFHADNSFDKSFSKYLFKNELFIDEMNSLTVGIREGRNIKYEDFANSLIFVPPLDEQSAIAAYLDTQCAKIDEIIAQAKASIEDYKQWKASIIYEAVTKGLDPNVEMKDSGILSNIKIPSQWNTIRMKFVSTISGRIGFRGYTTQDLVDAGEGALTLSPSNIKDNGMSYDKCSYISWDKYYESPEIMAKNGDILFVKTGSSYGKSALVEKLPMEATINPQLVLLKNIRGIDSKYLFYFLQSPLAKIQIEFIVSGGTIPTMSQEKMRNFALPYPPAKEQIDISLFLDKQCDRITELISEKQSLIDDLESYKKSLIYEVVTGKRRVV